MSRLSDLLRTVKEQGGAKAGVKDKLFGGIYALFEAADADREESMQSIREELRAEWNQTAAQLRAEREEDIRRLTERLQSAEATQTAIAQQLAILQEAVSEEGAIRQNLAAVGDNLRNNNAQLESLQSDLALTRVKLAGMERQLQSSITVQAPASPEQTAPQEIPAPADSDYDNIDYFDFENHFRGSIEHIKNAQRMYLPYFRDKRHVLDIGCGRGEFLTLLKEEGIPAEGVDVYAPYIDYCTMQGLKAHCGDGIGYLAGAEGVDGIFVGQVIEHLKTEQIVELCRTAFEKLPEGGCIILETPNPTSLSIYTNAFYLDPSHVKPVHPLTVQYLLEKAGFTKTEIVYPEGSRPPQKIPALPDAPEDFNNAMQTLSETMYGAQDYAVIAMK